MYLKLGKTKINYYSDFSDFMILSQVVNSKMSYEFPILVTSTEELDIWFGSKDFPDRDYLRELLSSDISLYLYRPINTEQVILENHIPYENFQESELYFLESDFPKVGAEDIKYRLVSSTGNYIDSTTGLNFDYLIWTDDIYVNVDELPQNLNNASLSLSNRDVLGIFKDSSEGLSFTYPKFDYGSKFIQEYEEKVDLDLLVSNLPTDIELLSCTKSLAFVVDFSEVLSFTESLFDEAPYISLSTSEGIKLIWFKSSKYPNEPIGIDRELVRYNKIEIDIDNLTNDQIIEEIKSIMVSLGYYIKNDLGNSWTIYSSLKLDVNYLFTLSNFIIEPDIRTTYNIITKALESNIRVHFWSKTIGHVDTDLINISIQKFKNNGINYYKVIILRGNYEELYEDEVGFEYRLLNTINTNSKLVYNLGSSSQYNLELPEGSWNLDMGWEESYDRPQYLKSLSDLLSDEGRFPDYVMIPEIDKYVNLESDQYLSDIENLVKLCIPCGTQMLIHNTEDNYTKNLITDSDNRLIYFYESILVKGNTRPGYYIFISGVLDDTYSKSTNNIIYYSPKNNPYDTSVTTEVEINLEKYKSNYLVSNNQLYYYNNYFNGEIFNTSIWMRFCLGKIYRQLQKNRWKFLSLKTESDIRNAVLEVLDEISTNFSIIRSITLSNFAVDFSNYTLDMTINTEISDLVDNNISLDVVLNFNKPQ